MRRWLIWRSAASAAADADDLAAAFRADAKRALLQSKHHNRLDRGWRREQLWRHGANPILICSYARRISISVEPTPIPCVASNSSARARHHDQPADRAAPRLPSCGRKAASQAARSSLYGRTRRSAGIFHASPILWIISTVSARRRERTSDAREREPRSSANSA
jgi:hypothetical protein